MYKQCKTEQSAQRQRQLELGLMQTMLTQRYEDISVSDLCDHLQIPRKSFYRYFSSKDGCLYALLDHSMMEFFESGVSTIGLIPGTPLGDLDRYFVFWKEHRQLLDALQRNSLGGILVERANRFALHEGHLPRQFKTLPPDIQGLAMAFSLCGLMSMILQWHRDGFRVTPDEMTKLAQEILTRPILPQ